MLLNQLETYLSGEGFCAKCGQMPAAPDRAVALYASELDMPVSGRGSGVLIHVRGERASDSAMLDAVRICRKLCEFSGALTPEGAWIARIEPEIGPSSAGFDQAHRPFFTMTLRVYVV